MFVLFDLLGDFSENRKHLCDFKIGPTVEEGVKKLRNLDRRPPSRIYRIGVHGENKISFTQKLVR